MHTKYRPIFILISLFFMGLCIYFFYNLKTGDLFSDLSGLHTKNIKDEEVFVQKRQIGSTITRTSFILKKEDCLIHWDVELDGLEVDKPITLIYQTKSEKNCQINQAIFESFQLSILKKVFHRFDPRKIQLIYLPQLTSYPFLHNEQDFKIWINQTENQSNFDQIQAKIKELNLFKSFFQIFAQFDLSIKLTIFDSITRNPDNANWSVNLNHLKFTLIDDKEN